MQIISTKDQKHKYLIADDVTGDTGLEKYPAILRQLLLNRGINTDNDAANFLNPDYISQLNEPQNLKDIDKSVKRIREAVKNNEKILIYSDYDADGLPGAVVLHDFFRKIGYENFSNYIPHRHNEGFGLNKEAIKKFGDEKYKLLITIDCGIGNHEEINLANELGIDVIVTDHHLVNGELPKAYAVINPKREDCDYPYKMLCGAGVVFKLTQSLVEEFREEKEIKEGWEKWLLDMVGIATLSDMVPLTGENRVLAFYGLKVLKKSQRPGLQKLLAKTRVSQRHLSEDDVGFTITPRINAASRMDSPHLAFDLFVSADESEADKLAAELDRINNVRKGTVAALVKEIKKIIEDRYDELKSVYVLGNPEWKPSLLGLAANTIAEDYNKPVFLWGRDGMSKIKGSCRSAQDINLVALMNGVDEETFLEFGGHAEAGGFSVAQNKVHVLEEQLERAFNNLEGESDSNDSVIIDKKLSIDEVNWDTWDMISKLSPFGVANPKPIFYFENVPVKSFRKFGKEKNHSEVLLENTFGEEIQAIKFFTQNGELERKLHNQEKINLVAEIEKSTFGYKPRLRLRIVDLVV